MAAHISRLFLVTLANSSLRLNVSHFQFASFFVVHKIFIIILLIKTHFSFDYERNAKSTFGQYPPDVSNGS